MKKVKIIRENVEFRCNHDEMKRVFTIQIPESEILKRYMNNPHAMIVDVCLEIAEIENEEMVEKVCMEFPKTWEEYENSYGFTDDREVYTNGSRLIPSFRVKQWLDHIKPKTDILDKIRSEIEEYRDTLSWESNTIVKWSAINHILEQIIDKYKARSEG